MTTGFVRHQLFMGQLRDYFKSIGYFASIIRPTKTDYFVVVCNEKRGYLLLCEGVDREFPELLEMMKRMPLPNLFERVIARRTKFDVRILDLEGRRLQTIARKDFIDGAGTGEYMHW